MVRIRTWTTCLGLGVIAACGGTSAPSSDPDAKPDVKPDVVCDGRTAAVAVGRVDVAISIAIGPSASDGTLDGVLALDVSTDGSATGALSILDSSPSLQAVSGQLSRGCLTLAAGHATVASYDTLTWDRFEIRVGDAGRVEGGSGRLAGTYSHFTGESVEDVAYTADLSVAADTAGAPFDLVAPVARLRDGVLPSDVLSVELGEPAAVAGASAIRLRANDVSVGGTPAPGSPVAGLVTSLSFHGPAFWPFGATISADPAGLADPSGNPLPWRGRALHTVADPGPMVSNLGFEGGIAGWSTTGHEVKVAGPFDTVDPVEGASQVVVRENSALAGYFDVAPGASSLSVSVALLSERVDFDADRSGVVALHRANGERIVLFDAQTEHARSTPCTCGDSFGARIAPVTKTVDLTPYRGERLFLTAETSSTPFFFGPKLFALVLDDLRIQ